jgi:hypothetical protein
MNETAAGWRGIGSNPFIPDRTRHPFGSFPEPPMRSLAAVIVRESPFLFRRSKQPLTIVTKPAINGSFIIFFNGTLGG